MAQKPTDALRFKLEHRLLVRSLTPICVWALYDLPEDQERRDVTTSFVKRDLPQGVLWSHELVAAIYIALWGFVGLFGFYSLYNAVLMQSRCPGGGFELVFGAYTPAMIEVPMTDAQFADATRRLQENGIQLSGPSGTLSKQGVTASYEYANGVMRINIIKKPMLIPESFIEAQLKSYLAKHPGSATEV